MIFESIEHAQHYAAGNKVEIVIYDNKVIDVTEFKDKHPGKILIYIKYHNFNMNFKVESTQSKDTLEKKLQKYMTK